jgi:hypothetical protein
MLGFLVMNSTPTEDYDQLYARFHLPVTLLNCGDKCAPYNERGVPFCCDTRHAIPSAYIREWEYLCSHTDLWHLWQGSSASETARLAALIPEYQVPIACLGHAFCQRDFRSIACRAFPFFPYFTCQGDFIGLAYYWEYEDRCWLLSNLHLVSPEYRKEFIAIYEQLIEIFPQEKETFHKYSGVMRQVFGRRHRAIPILHQNGFIYKITPLNGRARRIDPARLPKFGVYQIATKLPFPDEFTQQHESVNKV